MNAILILFVFSPLLGLASLLFTKRSMLVGILGTLFPLVCALVMYQSYVMGASFSSFSFYTNWFQFGNFEGQNLFQVAFELGVNGFSFMMMFLTAVLALLAAFAGRNITEGARGFYALLLVLEIGMLGVFAAENLLLFFFFFELTLPAMFLLVGKWGRFGSEQASYSYLIYNGIGSAILLVVFVILFGKTGTTNYEGIMQALQSGQTIGHVSEELKMGLFIALFIAFGIKLPIFPLHRWMVQVHVQAPPAVVMLHAGVLLKIGAYGLVRFGLGLFPEQFERLSFWIAVIGMVNVWYGALLALIQTNLRKVLAYSSISHMGIVLIGLAAMNEAGIKGAVFQVVSHGLIAALLFFLLGILEDRFGTSDLAKLGGLAKSMPLFGGFLLAGGMASLGLPGMSGFISEFLAFLGLFQTMPVVAAMGAFGIIVTAAYVLRAVLSITFGEGPNGRDLCGLEIVPAAALLVLIIAIGVVPELLGGPIGSVLQMVGR
ncbi:NADH-quinone oxidoreductase subunit M [Ectobacillus sp. JY-23]|uniref:NADH-quinone oxidoreductase subunit M n=1 Tax=Ectobacillus sp. JY-23 TaxID=2933872 RepID=UPI001FF6D691|nr:NADH-quinone oxidoreductase subunit M [Ectobacillus sp. JY-23]UOY91185.1 NADH-quinone oxidoreductase subunit M [Ectobacillus sp. JY-23]